MTDKKEVFCGECRWYVRNLGWGHDVDWCGKAEHLIKTFRGFEYGKANEINANNDCQHFSKQEKQFIEVPCRVGRIKRSLNA